VKTGILKLIFNVLGLGLALALAFSLALKGAPGGGPDDDARRQTAVGQAIATQGGLPEGDIFGYGQGRTAAFNKENWGYALAVFGLRQAFGDKAPGLARGASLLLCMLFLLATGFRRQARPFSTALFSLWALLCVASVQAGSVSSGLLLFSVCLFLMEGPFWRSFFGRWVWLPLLAVLWVNLDSGALILVPLCWLWAFAEQATPQDPAPQFPLISRVSVLTLLSASVFLHPALWRLPLDCLDWSLSPPFVPGRFAAAQTGLSLLALAFLFVVSTSWLRPGREHLGRDAWLLVFFGTGSLLWQSVLPYACVWAAPMLAARSDFLVDALPEPLKGGRWLLKVGLLAFGLWMLPGLLARPLSRAVVARPLGTLSFMKDELLEGNIFTESVWSGGVLEALAPGSRVFEHAGMLPSALRRARLEAARVQAVESKPGKSSWEEILERSQTDFALLRLDSPLAKAMARSAKWQPLEFDDASVLYARNSPGHAAVIKKYAPRGLRPGDMSEPFEASRLPQVEADLEERLLRKPNLGILYYYEALLWKERDKRLLARQWLEKGLRADPSFAPNYRLLGELKALDSEPEASRRLLQKAVELSPGER
jgi:hypothetical protein